MSRGLNNGLKHRKLISHDFELGDSEDETLCKKSANKSGGLKQTIVAKIDLRVHDSVGQHLIGH